MSELPEKLSGLIRVALADLKKVEADPRFTVEMGVWLFQGPKTCEVCLAGSVMAKTLNLSAKEGSELHVDSLDEALAAKMCALDWARVGYVKTALQKMGFSRDWDHEDVPNYDDEREKFHSYMAGLADRLEEQEL